MDTTFRAKVLSYSRSDEFLFKKSQNRASEYSVLKIIILSLNNSDFVLIILYVSSDLSIQGRLDFREICDPIWCLWIADSVYMYPRKYHSVLCRLKFLNLGLRLPILLVLENCVRILCLRIQFTKIWSFQILVLKPTYYGPFRETSLVLHVPLVLS